MSGARDCSRMPAHSDAWLSLGLQRVKVMPEKVIYSLLSVRSLIAAAEYWPQSHNNSTVLVFYCFEHRRNYFLRSQFSWYRFKLASPITACEVKPECSLSSFGTTQAQHCGGPYYTCSQAINPASLHDEPSA